MLVSAGRHDPMNKVRSHGGHIAPEYDTSVFSHSVQ